MVPPPQSCLRFVLPQNKSHGYEFLRSICSGTKRIICSSFLISLSPQDRKAHKDEQILIPSHRIKETSLTEIEPQARSLI